MSEVVRLKKLANYVVWLGGFYALLFLVIYGVCGKDCGNIRKPNVPDSAPYTVAGVAFVIWLLNEDPKNGQRKTGQAPKGIRDSRKGE